MQEITNFNLLFEGLKVGKHYFEYEVDKLFFANFDDVGILDAALSVNLELDKRETMMVGQFKIGGEIDVICDRCTADMQQTIRFEDQIVFKFSDEISEDESLFNIPSHEYKIDLKPIIYELTVVNKPIRNIHLEGGCDEEMLSALYDYGIVQEDEDFSQDATEEETNQIDPRWSALKNLKNNLE